MFIEESRKKYIDAYLAGREISKHNDPRTPEEVKKRAKEVAKKIKREIRKSKKN